MIQERQEFRDLKDAQVKLLEAFRDAGAKDVMAAEEFAEWNYARREMYLDGCRQSNPELFSAE